MTEQRELSQEDLVRTIRWNQRRALGRLLGQLSF